MSLDLSTSQNELDEIKIFDDTINNLTICKEYWAKLYAYTGSNFHDYLHLITEYYLKKYRKI